MVLGRTKKSTLYHKLKFVRGKKVDILNKEANAKTIGIKAKKISA